MLRAPLLFCATLAVACGREPTLAGHHPVPPGWERQVVAAGGFTVNMPHGTKTATSSRDGVVVQTIAGNRGSDLFEVEFLDLPSDTSASATLAMLHQQAVGIAADCSGHILTEAMLETGDHPVLKAQGECGDGQPIAAQVHANRGHVVSLVVLEHDARSADFQEIEAFFHSLFFLDV